DLAGQLAADVWEQLGANFAQASIAHKVRIGVAWHNPEYMQFRLWVQDGQDKAAVRFASEIQELIDRLETPLTTCNCRGKKCHSSAHRQPTVVCESHPGSGFVLVAGSRDLGEMQPPLLKLWSCTWSAFYCMTGPSGRSSTWFAVPEDVQRELHGISYRVHPRCLIRNATTKLRPWIYLRN
ncbi:unnamed protein product, partial [Polarella glacialis]